MSELLLKVQSNKLLAEDLRPSILYIYDDKIVFEGNEGVIGGQECIINYDQIAEVNQQKGILASTLEIVNKGGADDISIAHITNSDAEKAKDLIQDQARKFTETFGTQSPPPNISTKDL